MSKENKTIELKDEELSKVSGGEYIDENGHVFAFAPGFRFNVRSGSGKVYEVEECYVENGINKYKLSVYTFHFLRGSSFDGYVYWTEAEISDQL